MCRVAIHQSQYIPWPPYFQKMVSADIFVVMDSVQFQKNGVQNRNKIRGKEGDFWLTIPVTACLGESIMHKKIADQLWSIKHWKSIKNAYSRAPFWNSCSMDLESLYDKKYSTLGEVNKAFLDYLIKYLDIKTRVLYLSGLKVEGSKSELVFRICQMLGATIYVSGLGGAQYLKENEFIDRGIRIEYKESIPPTYPQFHGQNFISGLSIIDMMCNIDISCIKDYLGGVRTENKDFE